MLLHVIKKISKTKHGCHRAANLVSFLLRSPLLLLQAGQRRRTVAGSAHVTSGRLLHQMPTHPRVILKSVT